MNIDLEELAAIIEQLDKTEFTDFQYEHGDLSVKVRRGGYYDAAPSTSIIEQTSGTPISTHLDRVSPTSGSPAQSTGTVNPKSPSGPPQVISPNALPADHHLVTAPMLGTYYGAPKPGEAAFVQVGDSVSADAVLCIVEVMKLMNSVTAGAVGEVVAVFVQDGDLVEFEQPLFAIRAIS